MKIKVLLVQAGKEPRMVRMPANIKFIQRFIGTNLLKIQLDNSTYMYINSKANIEDFNRLYQGNIIYGDFIIFSMKKNKRVSIRKTEIQKYRNYFKLDKHLNKITRLKDEFLEEYYYTLRKNKLKNRKINKEQIFKIAA